MVDVERYLLYKTTGFLLTHSGSSFANFLVGFPQETFLFDLQYLLIWPLFSTLLTSYIRLVRWPSSRSTTRYTAADLEVILLQSLVDWLLNDHSLWLLNWRLALRPFFSGSRFPPLWVHNIAVITCSLLYKGLISYDILLWYDICVTHTKFLDKIRNLLVLLNIPKTEYGVKFVLRDASEVPYAIMTKGPGTIKALRIYQDCCTDICNVLPWIHLCMRLFIWVSVSFKSS